MNYIHEIFYFKQCRVGIRVRDSELAELSYKMAYFLFLADFISFCFSWYHISTEWVEKNECLVAVCFWGSWQMANFWCSKVHIHRELTKLLELQIGEFSDTVFTEISCRPSRAMVPLEECWEWGEAKNGNLSNACI